MKIHFDDFPRRQPMWETKMKVRLRSIAFWTIFVVESITQFSTSAVSAADRVEFDRDIRPILSDACFTCHGPDAEQREADLRLDLSADVFAERDPRIVVRGAPDKSELLRRITSKHDYEQMPPPEAVRQLSDRERQLIRTWIAEGAEWSGHWAFQSVQEPSIPMVSEEVRIENPIDRFIQSKLATSPLSPSPTASRETLIRRLTLDLTGLPPTTSEVDAFLADDSPNAYEKVVDRLLASPRYGERMATAWLDAARYSDSNGYQQEKTRTSWPWRDWLVSAINANMPYDQFTIEMLAGDLLPNATRDQQVATGFNRNHMLNGEGGRIAEESRVEYVVDRVETTATVWLGLTLGCARCHDHKYDPLTQNEFYQFYAHFNSIDERGNVDRGGNANPVIDLPNSSQIRRERELLKQITLDEQAVRVATSEENVAAWARSVEQQAGVPVGQKWPAIAGLPEAVMKSLQVPEAKRTRDQRGALREHFQKTNPAVQKAQQKLNQRRAALDRHRKSYLETMVMRDRKEPRKTYRLIRGQWDKPDTSVELSPSTPAILPPLAENSPANRLTLARWLVRKDHPLTARVAVNREWQRFFGQGLVTTTEDFGTQGERPTHPKLLDWLAWQFMENGWSLKRLHRLIVMSATYQQSSEVSPLHLEHDPYNRLLARGPRFRRTAQVIRDQALAVSGLLVEQIGGPPVYPYQPAGVWQEMTLGKITYRQDHGPKLYRRSLYTFWRRSVGPTMLFDTPARQVCSVRPSRTNTPLHALTLLNETAFVEAARVFAERIMAEQSQPSDRLRIAFRRVTSRWPTDAELKTLMEILVTTRNQYQSDPVAANELIAIGEFPLSGQFEPMELSAYTGVMNVIFNLDEAITKE
ncbi:PSD1 and planctomycete cytochrome C domain-containing protein [Thalassoroseus pseudoceratinae]|uniref:PSD1 and planctomycete cytochrome C domain-containing protein n=1 Tax=Thalassoroseus pseudoceratinae TaxID=2713176 RepID=UPI00197F9530|nr:PSD1 and planctomycete cytochrome C domain-containing protein [Thalassoroseus pseudoceratinae]